MQRQRTPYWKHNAVVSILLSCTALGSPVVASPMNFQDHISSNLRSNNQAKNNHFSFLDGEMVEETGLRRRVNRQKRFAKDEHKPQIKPPAAHHEPPAHKLPAHHEPPAHHKPSVHHEPPAHHVPPQHHEPPHQNNRPAFDNRPRNDRRQYNNNRFFNPRPRGGPPQHGRYNNRFRTSRKPSANGNHGVPGIHGGPRLPSTPVVVTGRGGKNDNILVRLGKTFFNSFIAFGIKAWFYDILFSYTNTRVAMFLDGIKPWIGRIIASKLSKLRERRKHENVDDDIDSYDSYESEEYTSTKKPSRNVNDEDDHNRAAEAG